MLVLTRKIDEQIVIGNDIKITLIRVRGNTVRLGIEAPRDVRIVRSELQPSEDVASEVDCHLAQREDAFAHPRTKLVSPKPTQDTGGREPSHRSTAEPNSDRHPKIRITSARVPAVYVGKVARDGSEPELNRAPLASFISAGEMGVGREIIV